MSIRKRISRSLSGATDLPHELAVFLANDHIDVAYPILRRSPVLQDEDLIEIIRNRTFEHQLAIATRECLSEDVSRALAETGERKVIEPLLRNPEARIARLTMEYLVEESRRVDSFQEPLVHRRELPPELAKRMFIWVSTALRKAIIERFELPEETVDNLLENAVLAEIEAMGPRAEHGGNGYELADALVMMDSASPRLLLGVLEAGEVSLFISLLERLTDLPRRTVKRILFEPGAERLAITCRAIGIEKVVFASVFSLTRRARPYLVETGRQDFRHTLDLFADMSQEAANRVLRTWRRGPDYPTAVAQVDGPMSLRV